MTKRKREPSLQPSRATLLSCISDLTYCLEQWIEIAEDRDNRGFDSDTLSNAKELLTRSGME